MKRIASAVVTPTGPNYAQAVETGGFTLLSDETRGAGGQGAGPAPYGLLLAGLGGLAVRAALALRGATRARAACLFGAARFFATRFFAARFCGASRFFGADDFAVAGFRLLIGR